MALTLDKPYLGLRASNDGGAIVFLPRIGFCNDVALDTPYIGLRASTDNGALVYLISDQKTEPDGTLTLDKPYIGLLASNEGGTPVYLVNGINCGDGTVTVCDVEMCCSLDGSVRIKTSATPTWTDWTDVTLSCGGEINHSTGHCCVNALVDDDIFCFKITTTVEEKNTLSTPESYDIVTSAGTRSCKSVIWTSGDFTISGKTYRLSYYTVETHVNQTSPTTATYDNCYFGHLLQELITTGYQHDVYGDYWNTIEGDSPLNRDMGISGMGSYWCFNVSNDSPYDPEDCPEGYNYASGELIPDGCSYAPAACAEVEIVDPCNADMFEAVDDFEFLN